MAVAVPAVVSVFAAPAAWADDGDDRGRGGDDDDERGRGRGRPQQAPRPLRNNTSSSDLCRVAQTATSGDFTSSNPGTDPLTDGRIRLRRANNTSEDRRAQVTLRGAAPNVSYDVQFWPVAAGKPRQSLGLVGPTNAQGDLEQLTPAASPLGGTARVGVFVLVRHDGSEGGKDEFISCAGG
jgi:hypothetical protein